MPAVEVGLCADDNRLNVTRVTGQSERVEGARPVCICCSCGIMWWFPEIGYLPIIHFSGIFPYEPSIWGTPISGNPQNLSDPGQFGTYWWPVLWEILLTMLAGEVSGRKHGAWEHLQDMQIDVANPCAS